MPGPDLADAGQLPGDFVQQGRVGLSEVEHGCVQSAISKDSAVGITKQPDHETLVMKPRQQQCAAEAVSEVSSKLSPSLCVRA